MALKEAVWFSVSCCYALNAFLLTEETLNCQRNTALLNSHQRDHALCNGIILPGTFFLSSFLLVVLVFVVIRVTWTDVNTFSLLWLRLIILLGCISNKVLGWLTIDGYACLIFSDKFALVIERWTYNNTAEEE